MIAKFTKRILIVFALLGVHNTNFAQISIEATSGISFANFVIDPAPETNVSEFKPGFRLGANLNVSVGKNGYLSSGLHYVQKGDKSIFDDSQTIYLRYNYLILPVVYKYNLLRIGKVKLQGFGGAYAGLLVSQRLIIDYGTYKMIYDRSLTKDLIQGKSDVGVLTGVSFYVPLGNGAIITNAQYERGLINVNENFDRVNTNCFSFSVGYQIEMKKKTQ